MAGSSHHLAISILMFRPDATYFSASANAWSRHLDGIVSWSILAAALSEPLLPVEFAFAFFYTFIVFKADETRTTCGKPALHTGIRPGRPRRNTCGALLPD